LAERAGVDLARASRQVAPVLKPAFATKVGREGEALERAWSMTYAKAIAHLPREALESAVEKYAQVGKWFPKPADLIELARPKATEILQLSYRLDRCATVKAREPVSDAERAEFQAFARDLAESLRTKTLFAGRVRECAA
jgi:hypothetical protein